MPYSEASHDPHDDDPQGLPQSRRPHEPQHPPEPVPQDPQDPQDPQEKTGTKED